MLNSRNMYPPRGDPRQKIEAAIQRLFPEGVATIYAKSGRVALECFGIEVPGTFLRDEDYFAGLRLDLVADAMEEFGDNSIRGFAVQFTSGRNEWILGESP